MGDCVYKLMGTVETFRDLYIYLFMLRITYACYVCKVRYCVSSC